MKSAGQHLRLVDQNRPADITRPTSKRGQLSLFDYRPISRVACLPMMDVHGAVFRRTFENLRPRALFDLRRAPFFDLTGLGRNNALHIIHSYAQTHLKCPMDLRTKPSSEDRWELKRQVGEFINILAGEISAGPLTAILLLNKTESVDFFVGLVPPSSDLPFSWQFEGPDSTILRQC